MQTKFPLCSLTVHRCKGPTVQEVDSKEGTVSEADSDIDYELHVQQVTPTAVKADVLWPIMIISAHMQSSSNMLRLPVYSLSHARSRISVCGSSAVHSCPAHAGPR